MPITYGDGGTNRTPTSVYYQDGATLRTISEIWYGDGGTNRQVYSSAPAFSVSAPNIAAVGTHPVDGTSTLAITGGTGPFTYAATTLSGGAGILFTGQATATLTATTSNPTPATYTATVRRTVTDSLGAVATDDLTVSLEVIV